MHLGHSLVHRGPGAGGTPTHATPSIGCIRGRKGERAPCSFVLMRSTKFPSGLIGGKLRTVRLGGSPTAATASKVRPCSGGGGVRLEVAAWGL